MSWSSSCSSRYRCGDHLLEGVSVRHIAPRADASLDAARPAEPPPRADPRTAIDEPKPTQPLHLTLPAAHFQLGRSRARGSMGRKRAAGATRPLSHETQLFALSKTRTRRRRESKTDTSFHWPNLIGTNKLIIDYYNYAVARRRCASSNVVALCQSHNSSANSHLLTMAQKIDRRHSMSMGRRLVMLAGVRG